MCIAVFVVVPGIDFDLRTIDDHRRRRINDAAAGIIGIIARHQRPCFVAQDTLERAFGRRLEKTVDLIHCCVARHLKNTIGDGSVQQGYTDSMTVQLTLELRIDQRDRGGRARGRGYKIGQC